MHNTDDPRALSHPELIAPRELVGINWPVQLTQPSRYTALLSLSIFSLQKTNENAETRRPRVGAITRKINRRIKTRLKRNDCTISASLFHEFPECIEETEALIRPGLGI